MKYVLFGFFLAVAGCKEQRGYASTEDMVDHLSGAATLRPACGTMASLTLQTRDVLGLAFAACLNAPIPGRPQFGVFRM